MRHTMRKGLNGIQANSKDVDQPEKPHNLIRAFGTARFILQHVTQLANDVDITSVQR